jgi:hypothetical protein
MAMTPAARLLAATLLLAGLAVARAAPEAPPSWAALGPAQQQALAPLQQQWAGIDADRKKKWLQVADRYARLSAAERERLHERMADWARMSPEQRARARLQFQENRRLPPEERQARWEAYQALSEDERRTLAARREPAEHPAAPAPAAGSGSKRNIVQPVATPPRKVVSPTVVQARPGATTSPVTQRAAPPAHHQAGLPKVAATPGFVDRATLLPKRGPQGAAVESRPAPSASSPDTAPAQSP